MHSKLNLIIAAMLEVNAFTRFFVFFCWFWVFVCLFLQLETLRQRKAMFFVHITTL